MLAQLEELLPEECSPFFNYLRSLKTLHNLCTARDLEKYDLVLHYFTDNFEYLYDDCGLNMSLKCHIDKPQP